MYWEWGGCWGLAEATTRGRHAQGARGCRRPQTGPHTQARAQAGRHAPSTAGPSGLLPRSTSGGRCVMVLRAARREEGGGMGRRSGFQGFREEGGAGGRIGRRRGEEGWGEVPGSTHAACGSLRSNRQSTRSDSAAAQPVGAAPPPPRPLTRSGCSRRWPARRFRRAPSSWPDQSRTAWL